MVTFAEAEMMVLVAKCEVCGRTETGMAKDLFRKGWDVPPYFSYVVTCGTCPSAPLVIQRINESNQNHM